MYNSKEIERDEMIRLIGGSLDEGSAAIAEALLSAGFGNLSYCKELRVVAESDRIASERKVEEMSQKLKKAERKCDCLEIAFGIVCGEMVKTLKGRYDDCHNYELQETYLKEAEKVYCIRRRIDF